MKDRSFFDVLCNIQQSTGEVKATAFYLVRLYEQFYGIPVLTRKIASFNTKRGWPDYEPNISFQMRNENEFTAMVNVLEEQEIVAEDIPLCSFETIKENIQSEIINGHIRKVFSIRFVIPYITIRTIQRENVQPLMLIAIT